MRATLVGVPGWVSLLLAVLAVWRVTHLLAVEEGPWRLLERLRQRLAGTVVGKALTCFDCLSLWVSAPFSLLLGGSWLEWLLLWLGFSGGAILLDRRTRPVEPSPIWWKEEGSQPPAGEDSRQ
jgi:hypothetical protein